MSRLIEIVLWWVVLTGLELMLISGVDRYELAVAVVLGLVIAVVTSYARSAQPTSWRLQPRMLPWLPLLLVPIVPDTFRVLGAALRGDVGSWRTAPIAHATGDTATARGARALGAIALNASPGSVVTDVDSRTGAARLHVLGGGSPSALERVLAR